MIYDINSLENDSIGNIHFSSFGDEDICLDVSDGKNVATLSKMMEAIRSVVPASSDSRYKNFCWLSSTLNLDAMQSLSTIQKSFQTQRLHRTVKQHSTALTLYQQVVSSTEQQQASDSELTSLGSLICLPGLFLAGFPKSGSTQLFSLITQHPLIQAGSTKECHWWTRFPVIFEHPFDKLSVLAYLKQFEQAGKCSSKDSQCIAIDGSQSLIWGGAKHYDNICTLPELVSLINPQSKFIVIMRNPVDRLYSDYWFFTTNHAQTQPSTNQFHDRVVGGITNFNNCFNNGSNSLSACMEKFRVYGSNSKAGLVRIQVGIYYAHIVKWLKFFPKDQFLFLRLEDMAVDPYTTLKKVSDFLGISADDFEIDEEKLQSHKLQSSYPDMPAKTAALLHDFYNPYNKKLAELLNDKLFLWED